METRSELTIKWAIYSLAALGFSALQGLLFSRLHPLGVTPWLLPMLPALLAVFEPGLQSTVFAIAFGVACDLALLGPFPCFYTLCFFMIALLAGLISTRFLSPGLLCSAAAALVACLTENLLHMISLRLSSGAAFRDLFLYGGKALLCSLPLVLLLHPVFSRLHKEFHRYD